MRRVNGADFAREMQARGLPTRRALGNYGDGDPNVLDNRVYSEREVFRGEQGNPGGVIEAVSVPVQVTRNRVFFNLIPFAYQDTDGSNILLPSNELRRFLSVQNQSTADLMYVNFSSEAGLNVGIELYPAQALIYDTIVPYNSITVFVASTTKQIGVVVEGAIQL